MADINHVDQATSIGRAVWSAEKLAALDGSETAEMTEHALETEGHLVVKVQVPNPIGKYFRRPGLDRGWSSFSLSAFCSLSPEEQKAAEGLEENGGVGVAF